MTRGGPLPPSTIGPELAQRIVERAMERLGHNVNVMDADGVIVGTGDSDRLGTTHGGAVVAIREGHAVEVDSAMAGRDTDVRPGINLPVVVDGRTVGAIGVTGDPARLRDVGELLRMSAELMVEQEGRLDEEEWRAVRLDALAQALVDPDTEPVEARRLAQEVGVDVESPRIALLVHATGDGGVAEVATARRSLHRSRHDVITSRVDDTHLMALFPRSTDPRDVWRDLGTARHRLRLVVGGDLPTLAASWASALDAHRLTCRSGDAIVRWDDDPFAAVAVGLPDDWRTTELAAPWRRLVDTAPDLADTVATLIRTHGDQNAAASELGIHRNTMRHRLDRVVAVTGVDPRRPWDMSRLVLGAVRDGSLCTCTLDG